MTTVTNNASNLETRALRYLAKREYSRRELENKLSVHIQSPHTLSNLLDQLEQQGYLSTKRFAEQTCRARRPRFGSLYIVRELKEKGVDEENIDALLPELKATDLETAQQIWHKKFGTPPCTLKERSKQTRFLLGRGFSSDIIRQVLSYTSKEES